MALSIVRMAANNLRCDVPGCPDEIAVRVGCEQRCFRHALERANEIRRARGLPPVTIDKEGRPHVCH